MSYAELDGLRGRLGTDGPGADDLLQAALDWATEWIDAFTHRRFVGCTETRVFDRAARSAEDSRILDLDEDLLSVQVLTNGDGTLISPADFWLAPRNERPYYQIRLTSNAWWVFPVDGWVQVTGRWGYAEQPDALIVGACLNLAEYFFRTRRLAEVVTLTSATTGLPATPKQYAFPDHVYTDLAPRVKLAR